MTQPKPTFWKDAFVVREFEVDTEGFALLSVIANHMQHTAGIHAAALGYSMQALLDQQTAWILNRFTFQLSRYPRAGETIHIETWPSGADRMLAYRDFELFDEAGELILAGRTAWLILDLVRRRPMATSEEILELGRLYERKARVEGVARMPRITSDPEVEVVVPVRRSDLDINRHVNNVKYLEWVLETLGEGPTMPRPNYVDIQFKAESTYGDVVVAQRHPAMDGHTVHRIIQQGDGKELTLALTR
jgi:acyl-ACP thioesterase